MLAKLAKLAKPFIANGFERCKAIAKPLQSWLQRWWGV
jgi:hypothetical protein